MELTKVHKTLIAAVGLITLGATWHTVVPSKAELRTVDAKIDRHILKDQKADLQKFVWSCRDDYGDDFSGATPSTKEECREAEEELKEIKDKLRGGE
jgi:hypothetical protein